MCFKIYYVHAGVCCRPCDVRGNAFLAVEGCLNAVFGGMVGYGKSPCFSHVGFLSLVAPVYPLLVLPSVDGVVFLECAFCYGSC
jgi:hypothetical protein